MNACTNLKQGWVGSVFLPSGRVSGYEILFGSGLGLMNFGSGSLTGFGHIYGKNIFGLVKKFLRVAWVHKKMARVRSGWPKWPRVGLNLGSGFDPTHPYLNSTVELISIMHLQSLFFQIGRQYCMQKWCNYVLMIKIMQRKLTSDSFVGTTRQYISLVRDSHQFYNYNPTRFEKVQLVFKTSPTRYQNKSNQISKLVQLDFKTIQINFKKSPTSFQNQSKYVSR